MTDLSPESPTTVPKSSAMSSNGDLNSVVENLAKTTQLSNKLNSSALSSSYSSSEKHSSSSSSSQVNYVLVFLLRSPMSEHYDFVANRSASCID